MTGNQTPIGDYALLADRRTAALVSRTGSMDWLCLPRFDADAVFCALLGTPENGRWLMAPRDGRVVSRGYRGDNFVLETTWQTPEGELQVTEFMPHDRLLGEPDRADVVRQARCTRGRVTLDHELVLRFRYGQGLPWMHRIDTQQGCEALVAISGPNGVVLHGPDLRPDDHHHVGSFDMTEGDELCWTLTWFPSCVEPPAQVDVAKALATTLDDWDAWSTDIVGAEDHPAVRRSLLVLRALTHSETGGIVAAPTTSLPELLGGERNWDYRYVWLRDSALTLSVMVAHGLKEQHWRDWLLRAVASDHADLQIMYGLGGERVDDEKTLEHLPGYADSRPVRVGNGATSQYQSDVVGEVMLALRRMREAGIEEDRFSWALQRALLDDTVARLDEKDHGIWEMRGQLQYFTHGRVMMWAAFDCGIRAVEEHQMSADPGQLDAWRQARERLHDEVMSRGFDAASNSFTQTYDNTEVDASLLTLPTAGFVAADDPRMLGTVARIEQELVDDHGFVRRYRTQSGLDGLQGDESPFLMCTFWLATQLARSGRLADAEQVFQRAAAVGGELQLLAEEYDPGRQRQLGNYPQAFSHLGLVEAASAIRCAQQRAGDSPAAAQHDDTQHDDTQHDGCS